MAWFLRIRFPEQRVCLISLAVLSSIPFKKNQGNKIISTSRLRVEFENFFMIS